jgi:hypothetical protein
MIGHLTEAVDDEVMAGAHPFEQRKPNAPIHVIAKDRRLTVSARSDMVEGAWILKS